jgi:FlaA1/EpsC-like NDP-sugar epimerase
MRLRYLRNIAFDLIINCLAWVCAYGFGVNFYTNHNAIFSMIVLWLPISLIANLFFGFVFSSYRMIWRYVSIKDLFTLIKVTTGIIVSLIVLAYVLPKYLVLSRSMLVLYAVFLFLGLTGARILARIIFESRREFALKNQHILILGGGDTGEVLLRHYKNHHSSNKIVGILDDNLSKRGMEIHGARFLGPINRLEALLKAKDINLVIIAIRSLSGKKMRELYELCEKFNVQVRIVPSVDAISSGRVRLEEVRPVEIEDLLGRAPVSLVNETLMKRLSDKVILVTGAGGSIGSELCRQIAMNRPKSLSLVDNNEYHLYTCHAELTKHFPDLDITMSLSDVSRQEEMAAWFEKIQPHVVFHAAAYKHVPMLETQLLKAVKNNVFGTQNVANLAGEYGVESFVLVSTDKAVNPTNIMGTTKRLAEIYCQTKNKASKTNYMTVRFGNVLGSNGSVLPLFRKQLAAGGPLTVTHRDMTRYFMMIPEAVTLILQTYLLGNGGEIFVLEMGQPIKIVDLAEKLISLSGQVPYEDIDIQFTGIRPGEKLFEEIFHDAENMTKTNNEQILVARCREYKVDEVDHQLKLMNSQFADANELALLQSMLELVPEYKRNS